MVITVKDTVWEGGFAAALAALQDAGRVDTLEETAPYVSMPGEGGDGAGALCGGAAGVALSGWANPRARCAEPPILPSLDQISALQKRNQGCVERIGVAYVKAVRGVFGDHQIAAFNGIMGARA